MKQERRHAIKQKINNIIKTFFYLIKFNFLKKKFENKKKIISLISS